MPFEHTDGDSPDQVNTFNAARARAKRPCPLWVDAFQRDTQHLEADEVGAYMLILMAMWTREACDFPDDDTRLARVCRVSKRLWMSRVGPAIRAFLAVENGAVISNRLRREAAYVERQCKQQSDRKKGENPDKALKDNEPPPTVDTTTDEPQDDPRHHPSQQPNNLQETVSSLRSDTDGGAVIPLPDETDRDFVWRHGPPFLCKTAKLTDVKAREMIGKWLKGAKPSQLREALRAAQQAKTRDPVPYITEILKPKPQVDVAALISEVAENARAN